MDNTACDGKAFWDSISCRKYTEINDCVVRGVLAENRLFLEKREVLSKNIFATLLKMLRIVYLHCRSSLLVVCGSGIWLENPRALTMRVRVLL